MLSRKIVIGCITSTEFLKEIEDEWNSMYIESRAGRMIADWCWEYFKQYKQAPMQEIETIYITKLKKGIDKELACEMEEEILPNLSEEYTKERKSKHLVEKARDFFTERQLQIHADTLLGLLEKGKVEEAKKVHEGFKLKEKVEMKGVDFADPLSLEKVKQAFDEVYQNVIKFTGALGDFLNDDLVRGSLIGIQASEKRGKTFLLLELMMTAYEQGKQVAFFQAGDMTENQQIIRIGIYLTQRSNKEKYTGTRYIPVQDCIHNQKDTCNRKIRACDFGLFGEEMNTREDITKEDLVEAYESNPDYKPCYNCIAWNHNKWGTPWLKKIEVKKVLTRKYAVEAFNKFFVKAERSIKLMSYPTGTLTATMIQNQLDQWKEREQFEPDVILVDYPDIMDSEIKGEFRHQENDKWMRLRGISQKSNSCLIVPTQAKATSYKKKTQSKEDYSEDKRKYAHVTAMYGLNQDPEDREKKIGILRINRLVLREGEFITGECVHVLQHLAIGRPNLGSYY